MPCASVASLARHAAAIASCKVVVAELTRRLDSSRVTIDKTRVSRVHIATGSVGTG